MIKKRWKKKMRKKATWPAELDELRPAPKDRHELRWKALTNLWGEACNQLMVRYPDPRVEVTVRLGNTQYYGHTGIGILGEFWASDLRDNRNPDRLVNRHLGGFGVGWIVNDWYGYAAARYYLTSAWRSFLSHESAELVLEKSKVRPAEYDIFPDIARVYDPHMAGEYAAINSPIFDLLRPGEDTFKRTLAHLIGAETVGVVLSPPVISQAKQQLENEIDFLENSV